MNTLNAIFSAYDNLIVNLSPSVQAMVSLLLLGVLVWQIYMVIKSGHWIFIALLFILLPGTWPAARMIGNYVLTIIHFLITRAQIAL